MTDVFDLAAKLTIDTSDYDKGLERSEKKAGGFGKALSGALKVGGAAIAGAATAIGALTASSVKNYAEFEQLTGGVKKLYGNMGQTLEEYAKSTGKTVDQVKDEWTKLETAQNMVLDNASKAFATAGMSANEYMDIATSFSASLINSVGGDSVKAAELTDVAMRSISDNWNTFGGDLEAIQNAYKGFSKQNYNMLDNLKLGYGGTKEEMQRLIKDANEYAKSLGMNSKLSMDSFADIVTAIELIQKKQNIYETTSREAQTTIQGSLNMTKKAWENLITGISDKDADIGALVENLIKSATAALGNLVPVVERALTAAGQAIEKLVPQLMVMIVNFINNSLPTLLQSALNIVKSIAKAIMDNAPVLLQAAVDLVLQLGTFIAENAEKIFPMIAQLIIYIADAIINNIDKIIDVALDIIVALGDGLIQAVPMLLLKIPEIIAKIVEALIVNLPKLVDAGKELLNALWKGIVDNAPKMKEAVKKMIDTIKTAWKEKGQKMREQGKALVDWIKEGWQDSVRYVKEWGKDLIDKIKSGITGAWSSFITPIKNKFKEVETAIKTPFENVKTAIERIWNAIKTFLGTIFGGILTTATNAWTNIKNAITGKATETSSETQTIFGGLKSKLSESWNGLKGVAGTAWSAIKSAITGEANDTEKSVKNSADSMGKAVKGAFTGAQTGMEKPFDDAERHIKNGLSNLESTFANTELTIGGVTVPDIEVKASGSKVTTNVKWSDYKLAGRANKGFLADAYNTPFLFTRPTQLSAYTLGDNGAGGELVYGKDQLMRDIAQSSGKMNVTINVYAQPNQDERLIAEQVQREFVKWDKQRRAGALSVG